MTSDEFKATLESTIDAKFAEIMKSKAEADRFLSYIDAVTLTTTVRNIFKRKLRVTPPQVEIACKLSEAVMAPTARERLNLIKAALLTASGVAGIAMIIGGIGAILGWGAGVVAAVTAFFIGTSIAGPIAWIGGGVACTIIAGYFACTGNKQTDTERFLKVLKKASAEAVDAIWPLYEADLSQIETPEKQIPNASRKRSSAHPQKQIPNVSRKRSSAHPLKRSM